MALGWSTALANSVLDNFLNSGAGQSFLNSAIIEIRSGTRPASADTAPAGTLLAEITAPADAMAAASSGACAKSGTWADASADASGTAAWFRVKLSGDAGTTNTTDKRLDGNVTVTGGGGDMTVNDTSVVSASPFTINTFTLSLPG